MKRLSMVMLLALCVPLLTDVSYAGYANTTPAQDAYGQIVRIAGGSTCKATAAPPSYSEGDEVPLSCELDGDLRTNSTGGGVGGGDASLAEQQAQTGLLTTIDADTGNIAAGVGATTDEESTAGGEGTISAKLRNATALLDTSNTTLSTLNSKLPSAGALADDTSNPTTTGVASYNMCFDGTTWDRCVKASAGQGAADSATQRVVIAQGATACPNYIAISQTADTTLVSGTASQYFYICSIILVAGAAEVVSLWEGTGTACGTGSTAVLGSTTEANGLSISANGGFSAVSGVPFLRTATTANDICLRQSGSNRVSGVITYYKAP